MTSNESTLKKPIHEIEEQDEEKVDLIHENEEQDEKKVNLIHENEEQEDKKVNMIHENEEQDEKKVNLIQDNEERDEKKVNLIQDLIHEIEEEDAKKVNLSHLEIVSNLPKAKGWISEKLSLYQGFWCLDPFGVLSMQSYFKARPSDVLLLTVFKSGTTWLKALVFAIVNRGLYTHGSERPHPLLVANPHECVPSLEFASMDAVEEMPSPRILGTHVPFASLPSSVSRSACRVICMCRDPKDVLVSMWHFANKGQEGVVHVSLDEAFMSFCRGVSPYGPYWNTVRGYYEASLRSPNRIFFLKYEDMHADPTNQVKRLADFVGYPFSVDEEAKGVIQEITELCSFENLSNLEVNKSGSFQPYFKNNTFFRKGKVGDSRNYLTVEMMNVLDQISETEFKPYTISFP